MKNYTRRGRERAMGASSDVLRAELRTYEKRKRELLREHAGEWVLIHDQTILGFYGSRLEAIHSGYRQLGNTAFLTRKIEPSQSPCELASFTLDS